MSSRKNQTRDRILAASVKLLESGTHPQIRMSDIAKAAKISRQALYLHFETRADLLIETTYYVDEKYGSDARLKASRQATNGVDRLRFYVTAWGNYIPEIYSVASVLIALQATDKEAAEAWGKRMDDMREGCEAALSALQKDGQLTENYSLPEATDILWTLLSVRNWEQWVMHCGWTQEKYIKHLLQITRDLFVV